MTSQISTRISRAINSENSSEAHAFSVASLLQFTLHAGKL